MIAQRLPHTSIQRLSRRLDQAFMIQKRFLSLVRIRARNMDRDASVSDRNRMSFSPADAPKPDVHSSCFRDAPFLFRFAGSGLFSLISASCVGPR